MAADDSTYKPGDPPPGGYLNWHAWAEVQDKAGLRQKQCAQCGLWKFPQELSGTACSVCSTPGVPAVAPTEFKLQVGRTYLDRKGRRVTILERFAGVMYPYCGDNGIKYLEHGFQFDGGPGYNESDEDLLVEAPAGVSVAGDQTIPAQTPMEASK